MRNFAIFVLVLCSSVAASAKEPWEWTVEERLKLRFDAAAVRERVSAHQARRAGRSVATSSVNSGEPIPADYISGKAHPEAYFPSEIVTMFVRSAYAFDDEAAAEFRLSAAQRTASLGLPEELLSVFAHEAEEFILMMKEEVALRDRMDSAADAPRAAAELQILQSRLCPVRFALMRRMRQRYGTDFDRWLYRGLAPDWATAIFTTSRNAETLRNEEQGCR